MYQLPVKVKRKMNLRESQDSKALVVDSDNLGSLFTIQHRTGKDNSWKKDPSQESN
ncbi:hypothetical protein QYM36_008572, partial [Artemia franciscana]